LVGNVFTPVYFGMMVGISLGRSPVISEPLSPELEAKAQDLAARIRSRSEASILDMARKLVATTDDTLFGDTEFALRDQALGLVAEAYAEHLPKKLSRQT
jgi:hypothetical protein